MKELLKPTTGKFVYAGLAVAIMIILPKLKRG